MQKYANKLTVTDLTEMIDNNISSCNGLGGGGNSFWNLTKENNEFYIEYYISGAGNGSSIKIKLPTDNIMKCLQNILMLINFNSDNTKTMQEFITFAESQNMNVICD